ncbi:hypothetical protein ACWHA1_01740 [Streptomyces decoyicus]
MTINQQFRIPDLLETFPIARDQVLSDASYVDAEEWHVAREQVVAALDKCRVLFLVAPRRFGATTFTLRLLGEATHESVALQIVEANWRRPRTSKLPARDLCAYVLDLQDPECDELDSTFLSGLLTHEQNLKSAGSCLVITVAPEIWSHVAGQVPSELGVVRLHSHPKAEEVARKHLTAHRQAGLLKFLDESVKEDIREWTPDRAVWLVDEMIALQEANDRIAAEEGREPASYADRMHSEVRSLAGRWDSELKQRFGDIKKDPRDDKKAPLDDVHPLDLNDRCLSVALAVRKTAPVSLVQGDAQRLSDILAGARISDAEKGGKKKQTPDLRSVFSGVGLRTRLNGIGADVRFGEAHFKAEKYGDAVLAHVWDQYHPLHNRLITWMVSCGAEESSLDDPAVRAILSVLSYHQDDSKLTEVRDQAATLNKRSVAIAVLIGAARDEHLGRRARSLLYNWASQGSLETLQLVVEVCSELINDQPAPALTRLRRAADNAAKDNRQDLYPQLLAAFKRGAQNPALTAWFGKAVKQWQEQAGAESSPAVNLGVLALMSVDESSRPWLLTSNNTKPEFAAALRSLFADLDDHPEVIDEIIRWMRLDDGALHDEVVTLIQEAVADRVGWRAMHRLVSELLKVRNSDGSNTGDQLKRTLETDPDLGGLPFGVCSE